MVWGGEGVVRGMLGRQSEYIKTHLDSLCASLTLTLFLSPFITSVDALKIQLCNLSSLSFPPKHNLLNEVKRKRKGRTRGHVPPAGKILF